MVIRDTCPACRVNRYKKNGHTRHGKQNHQCKACGRQFTADAMDRLIAPEQRRRLAQLLCERISLRGICRAVGVSLTWLLHFLVECFTTCPNHLHAQCLAQPTAVVMSRLEAEADAMWSFVQKKANKQWIWIGWTPKRVRSLRFMWGIGVVTVRKRCGPLSPRSTGHKRPCIRGVSHLLHTKRVVYLSPADNSITPKTG
jgi:hypothetical protein